MPIYAYRCGDCGFYQDVLQKISDPILTVCPSCGKPEFKKQVTAAGFQLKGSGWYVTDFKGSSNATAADKPNHSAASPSENSTTDSSKPQNTDAAKTSPPSSSSSN